MEKDCTFKTRVDFSNDSPFFYFAKVRENAIIPTKRDGDAGYDIYPNFEEDFIRIEPHETKLIGTGIASALSNNLYLQVEERGSTGARGIKRSSGVIDASYRGEIFVAISNINDKPLYIIKKDKPLKGYDAHLFMEDGGIEYPYEKAIAQLILHYLPDINPIEIFYEDLKTIPSDRGDNALGSSGK